MTRRVSVTPLGPTAAERIREFAVLADEILDNPAVIEGLTFEMRWQATPGGPPGHGTWTVLGPNHYLFRALLLDVRNVIQPGSDLELREVLRDLWPVVEATGDAEALATLCGMGERFTEYGESGITTENGKLLRPAEIVRLWMYGTYHHRDLAKLRQLRALHPFQRTVHQQEFVAYVANVVHELGNVRHFIGRLADRGLLEGIEIPAWRDRVPPQPEADPRQVALLALLADVAAAGGDRTVTWQEIIDKLEPYGGPGAATLRIQTVRGPEHVEQLTLHAGRRDR